MPSKKRESSDDEWFPDEATKREVKKARKETEKKENAMNESLQRNDVVASQTKI